MSERGLAALEQRLASFPLKGPNAVAILGERGVFLPHGLDPDDKMTMDLMEAAIREDQRTIATLRAALDGLVEAGESYIVAVDADLYRPGTPEDWWNREATLAALRAALATAAIRAALATAKETP